MLQFLMIMALVLFVYSILTTISLWALSEDQIRRHEPQGDITIPQLNISKSESYYQGMINDVLQGDMEVRTPAGTFVDIVTDDFAIEVEFAHKWYEAIGQAVHYGQQLGKKPVIYLIARKASDERHIVRALETANNSGRNIPGCLNLGVLVMRDYE